VRQKFTQKERDTETGFDFFEARYYASTEGRFTSADPVALTASRLLDPQRISLYSYARNNPLKYIDPDGEDTVTTQTREYDFTIEKRGKDDKEREWVYQVKVSVKETTVTRRDDDGNVTQRSTTATATAENTRQATNKLSQGQLDTVGKVTGIIVEEAASRGMAPSAGLAIGTRETMLGSENRNVQFQFQQPKLNPLQLTMDSGKQPTTDLRANIGLSLDHYAERSAGRSAAEGFQRYGPGIGNAGGAGYGNAVAGTANRIRDGINGSIRTTGFHQRYEIRGLGLRP
jgi:RHS repeat-associated protein